MGKTVCAKLLNDLKDILGEQASNEVVGSLMKASDVELKELRASLDLAMRAYASAAEGRRAEEKVAYGM